MRKSLVFRLLAFAVVCSHRLAGASFADCKVFFYKGETPVFEKASPQSRELCFDSFAILYSPQSKTPLYVAERLSRARLEDARQEVRHNRFYEEARLPFAERARLQDYKATTIIAGVEVRFDRGHQAPAGDMASAQSMAQSFSMANMVPQAPRNNQRTWAGIEKATRKYVARATGDVYVITGPVFTAPIATLGPGRVWIPKYLFKLVFDPSRNLAWAHWLENSDDAHTSKPISYEELVKRTGVRFLPRIRSQD